jgi:hypothetical protein
MVYNYDHTNRTANLGDAMSALGDLKRMSPKVLTSLATLAKALKRVDPGTVRLVSDASRKFEEIIDTLQTVEYDLDRFYQ